MDHNPETNYDLQVRLVEAALEALGTDQPHRASEILAWIEKNHSDELEMLRASWGSYLSRAASDPTNRIERTPGRYTYSLRAEQPQPVPSPPEPEPTDVKPQPDAAVARQQRETLLYPPLAMWLRSRGYSARVTATSRRGGAWGNPDVTGINVVDGFLGQKSLEIATVEAKISSAQWRYYLFEAVAHKRFAQRAYFAFAQPSDEPTLSEIVDATEMREYGEKYRIGIIVVFLPTDTYTQLLAGNVTTLKLALEEMRIEELWPAIYDDVAASSQLEFVRSVLGLQQDRDVYTFDERPT